MEARLCSKGRTMAKLPKPVKQVSAAKNAADKRAMQAEKVKKANCAPMTVPTRLQQSKLQKLLAKPLR